MKKLIFLLGATLLVFLLVMLIIPTDEDKNKKEIVDIYGHIYKGQRIEKSFIPPLRKLSERASWLNTERYIHEDIKNEVEKMIRDAEEDGACLVVSSGYRNPERQKEIYESKEDKSYVAKPYESEHQTGLAVDIRACPMNSDGERDDSIERLELRNDFKELPEYCWLVRNAYKYNFEQSFTEYNKDITGYPPESWHWKKIIINNK